MTLRSPIGFWLLLCLASSLVGTTALPAADPPEQLIDWNKPPAGALVIVGGALRFDDPPIWEEIVLLAREFGLKSSSDKPDKPKILVFGTASSHPGRAGLRSANALIRFGADAVVSPLVAPGVPPIEGVKKASLQEIAEQVAQAQGVFFTGGEQSRILAALRQDDGQPNVVLRAIIDLYQRGGVIAGTSAGAAIMSRIAYRDAEFVLPTLVSGVRMGREIDRGLGVMMPDWFIDQHCLIRGRFARSLVVMQKEGFPYGLGIDENTALVIQGTDLRIVGYKGAIFLDASQAKQDKQNPRFNWRGIKLTYLDRGDRMDLKTLAVTPSMEKQGGEKIDPTSSTFKPYYKVPLYSTDVIGNTSLIDMMARLMESQDDHGLGLAFDGVAALRETTPGFEFRLRRGPGTVAWVTGAFGGEDFTIKDVYLDILPVDIGPLYK